MRLRILSVAYPFAPVGDGAVGGAEQIVADLDRALVAQGHRSVVVARAGSQVGGELIPIEDEGGIIDDPARQRTWRRCRQAIGAALARERFDLVHMHGSDFYQYLPRDEIPTLVTLHLPPEWYPKAALRPNRPALWLHCVSQSQHRRCGADAVLLPPIANGVPVERLRARHAKRRFALTLGRICPEKGVHLAIGAAKQAEIPLLIAGAVYPYPEHEQYFCEAVRPALDRERRLLGPLGFRRKRQYLSAARCLLVPSLAAETSSLVAMEALACGTPVIAFAAGALPEIVEHGRTGFIVRDVDEMAAAIPRAGEIDPAACRAAARARFDLARMTGEYLALYRRLAQGAAAPAARALALP